MTSYRHLAIALEQLAARDHGDMTKTDDLEYQALCSWASPLAAQLGNTDLANRLARAAITCHSCGVDRTVRDAT